MGEIQQMQEQSRKYPSAGKRAVFLDRDGVLNRAVIRGNKPYPPASLEELEIPEGVPDALRALKGAGFLLIGITNQPDVARGRQRREVVESINRFLLQALPLDDMFVCYHHDEDECECRKPKPGLLHRAACRHGIDLALSFMVGDRWKDIEAGRRAGCTTIFLDQQYAEKGPERPPDYAVRFLSEAAVCVLHHPVKEI
jgi:D-glycero-D-manno-heptose 1,7-bisphosphate phosphatase